MKKYVIFAYIILNSISIISQNVAWNTEYEFPYQLNDSLLTSKIDLCWFYQSSSLNGKIYYEIGIDTLYNIINSVECYGFNLFLNSKELKGKFEPGGIDTLPPELLSMNKCIEISLLNTYLKKKNIFCYSYSKNRIIKYVIPVLR